MMRCPWLLLLVLPVVLVGADLGRAIAQDLHAVPTGGGASVMVRDCAADRNLVAHRPYAIRHLASITKLYVSAAALADLGPEYQFTTALHGRETRAGHLASLAIRGGGSPALDEHFHDGDPEEAFRRWIHILKERGIHTIDGDLIIDDGFFTGPAIPTTYPPDHRNRQQWYSAPASAFAWNDNCIEVRVMPAADGGRGIVQTRPSSSRITITNRSKTVGKGGSRGIIVSRAHHANHVIVGGSYSKTTSWFPLAIHENPALLHGDHFAEMCGDHGIAIKGEVRLGSAADLPVIHVRRDPLVPTLAILNQRSQNFYGEQIARVLSRHRGGDGSVASGAQAVTATLEALDPAAVSNLELVDGSGLSYANQGTAASVTALLDAMAAHPEAETYVATLKDKWSGRVKAKVKTGSLAVARCLAGYVDKGGRRYAFAILLERGDASSIGWASRLRDRLFNTICSHLP